MHRRGFLRGVGGVALGLPFLESLGFRRFTRADPPAPLRRFVVNFTCNGVNREVYYPPGPFGPLTAEHLGQAYGLGPLRDYASDLQIVRGLHMVPKGFGLFPQPGCDHERGVGCKLTAQPLSDTADLYANGESVDQYIARRINPEGREALTMMVGPSTSEVSGFISYRGPRDPVPPINDPWVTYQDLVAGSAGRNLTDEARERLLSRRQSVLDLVREDLDEIRRQPLGRDDRLKLDMHLTTIRELEVDLADVGSCAAPVDFAEEIGRLDPSTVVENDEFKRIGRMQVRLLVLALACGRHRVASLMWGTGAVGPIFRWDGMLHDYNHHKLSHGNTKDDSSGDVVPNWHEKIAEIDRWYAGEFVYLLDLLSAYDEGEHGSILDQSAVLWINELSSGYDHDFRDLPVVIAGSAGGRLDTGRYLAVTTEPDLMNEDPRGSHDKLLNTMINVTAREDDEPRVTDFGFSGAPGGELRILERS